MTHTPTRQGEIIACQDCSFRAILTNVGPFVRDAGDPAVDHIGAPDLRRTYVEHVMRGFHARSPRPIFHELYKLAWAEGDEVSYGRYPAMRDDGALTMRQIRKYSQWLKAEHGL